MFSQLPHLFTLLALHLHQPVHVHGQYTSDQEGPFFEADAPLDWRIAPESPNKCSLKKEGPMIQTEVPVCQRDRARIELTCKGGCLRIFEVLGFCKMQNQSIPVEFAQVKQRCEAQEGCSYTPPTDLSCSNSPDDDMAVGITFRCDGGEGEARRTGYKKCWEKHGCPIGWSQLSTGCYFVKESPMNWEESKKFCSELQAEMVIIENEEEMQEISHLVRDLLKKKLRLWLGVRNIGGVWETNKGKKFSFIDHIHERGIGDCLNLGAKLYKAACRHADMPWGYTFNPFCKKPKY